MDDEKKRKKNKKKKNKQTKSTNTVSGAVGESAFSNNNHVNETDEQDEQKLISESAEVQADCEQNTEVKLDRDCNNGTDGSLLTEAEKQLWLDKEATLEGKIRQLQKELDAHKHKEADLESNILQAQNENVSCFQKQADLEKTIMLLQTEKSLWIQKETSYEKRIDQLVDEAATLSAERLSLEEKINLLEKDKDSWLQMENANKETIATLNDDNTRLRAQVLELEASRSNLFDQNQELMENITGLRMHVQNLEIANANLSSGSTMSASESQQLEAARALVEKLLSENAQLVEKVNELYIELDQRSVTEGPSLSANSDPIAGSDQTTVKTKSLAHGTDPVVGSSETASIANHSALENDPMPTTGERPASGTAMNAAAERPASGTDSKTAAAERSDNVRVPGPMFEIIKRTLSVERLDSIDDNVIKPMNGGNYINADPEVIPYSRDSVESSEIVQIPLDENEVKVTEVESPQIDEKIDVPLTDAPLIGAPFRLISYFARYVSGADLVNKNSLNS